MPVKLDPRQAAWFRGDLSYQLRPNGQTAAYRWIKKWKEEHPTDPGPLLICAHRRFGKGFITYSLAAERASMAPRQRIRIYSPTQRQGVRISDDVWVDVLADKPKEIGWKEVGGDIEVFNPAWKKPKGGEYDPDIDCSRIAFHGTEVKSGSQSRGVGADLIILDEAQDMKELEKLMRRVVGWQVAKRRRALIVILFTPPYGQHFLNQTMIPEAIAEGRYFDMPISKDLDFTEDEKASLEKVIGSRHSVAWQIEGECHWQMSDPGDLVLAEWTHYDTHRRMEGKSNDLIWTNEYKLPKYYFPIVSIDWGFRHFTSVLYSYWDYEQNLWIIARELWTRLRTTPEMLDLIKKTTADVFPKPYHPVWYYGDLTSEQQAEDLRRVWKFHIVPDDRMDKEAALAAVNALISRGEIRIHASCRALLHQLCYGCWKGTMKGYGPYRYPQYLANLSNEPNNLTGDLDAIDALRFGYRTLKRFQKNPVPNEPYWDGVQMVVDDDGSLKVLKEEAIDI